MNKSWFNGELVKGYVKKKMYHVRDWKIKKKCQIQMKHGSIHPPTLLNKIFDKLSKFTQGRCKLNIRHERDDATLRKEFRFA